jgi:putative SOS response-associated peptidase YedK
MCGRFTIHSRPEEIESRFHLTVDRDRYEPTYNAAPGKILPVITNSEPQRLSFFKWGLVPYWASDPKVGNRLINARAETLLEKPSFKSAMEQRRCLIPVNGFYEWRRQGTVKHPYYITLTDTRLFALAGLWESWQDSKGKVLNTFAIITVPPNTFMRPIYNRMPAILHPNDERIWLEDTFTKDLLTLLQPYSKKSLTAHPVSQRVNKPDQDDQDLIQPLKTGLF